MGETTDPGADRAAGPDEAAELREAVVVTLSELSHLSAELDLADRAACTPRPGRCQTEPPSVRGVELSPPPTASGQPAGRDCPERWGWWASLR